jgi:hypothetical protein
MQVSKRFCTLTSPESTVRKPGIQGPLARRPVCPGQTARILRAVLPPFNGGLHCGESRRWTFTLGDDSAPAFQRRAPLRSACGEPRAHRRIACYLHVRLDPLSAPCRTRALAAFCEQLSTAPAATYPGTTLTLHYEVKEHHTTT